MGTGVMIARREVTAWVCFGVSSNPLENSTGNPGEELHYAVEGTSTSSRRLFLRLQDTLLPFLEGPWMNFTHTLSCLNCTRNLSHSRNTINHPFLTALLKSIPAFSLTHLRCLYWAAPCPQLWPRCGGVWWWSQSDARCSVRSRPWWLKLSPEIKQHNESLHLKTEVQFK